MGVPITWIQPYKFNQRLPFDVDYKVMGTFLEFYQGLVKFINYKLFSDAGLQYPIKEINPVSRTSVYLDPSKVRQMQQHIGKLFSDARENHDALEFKDSPEMQKLTQKHDTSKKQRKLFQNCHFMLGRETPIYIL
jgi:pescadillo protein